jgi:TIR domain
MTAIGTKPVIFISYAHADEPEKPLDGVQWLSFVAGFLKPAEKRGALEVWTDRLMPGGAEWNSEIERKLQKCDVFVLLVSRHSMASDFVLDKEIRFIRERQAKAEDVQFYPLLLTPTPKIALDEVRDKNMRPLDAKPFSSYSLDDRLQHMSDAADEILKIAGEIADRKSAPSPQSAPASPPKPTPAQPPSSQPATTAAPPPAHSRLPPNPKMIGREDRLEELVKAILEEDRPIVVPGALGMGKTTLALAAAYDARVVERFGKERRFFVNLEPAPNAEASLRGSQPISAFLRPARLPKSRPRSPPPAPPRPRS